MGLSIKTHKNGNSKTKNIPNVPSFNSVGEAYDWVNGAGAETVQLLFKDEYDNGTNSFTLDYS